MSLVMFGDFAIDAELVWMVRKIDEGVEVCLRGTAITTAGLESHSLLVGGDWTVAKVTFALNRAKQ